MRERAGNALQTEKTNPKEVVRVTRNKGFTLIELIAVVAIIAILAAVILPNVFNQIRKARVSRMASVAEDLRRAALMYFSDVGAWPTCPSATCSADGAIDQLLTNPAGVSNWRGPYLDKAPRERADGRYANQYDGCLMLNDVDDGNGDDAGTGDRNSNGVDPDRFVYFGEVPAAEANDLDEVIDGGNGSATGAIIGDNTGAGADTDYDCDGTDDDPDDWDDATVGADDPVTVMFIINEGD